MLGIRVYKGGGLLSIRLFVYLQFLSHTRQKADRRSRHDFRTRLSWGMRFCIAVRSPAEPVYVHVNNHHKKYPFVVDVDVHVVVDVDGF